MVVGEEFFFEGRETLWDEDVGGLLRSFDATSRALGKGLCPSLKVSLPNFF